MFANKSALLKKIFFVVVLFLFVVLAFRTLESHIFNIHFVDEDENMVAGYYMAKGQKLYADIFSHKQPMPAVFSALINKIFKPGSLFLFVKRHREAVFLYSILWGLAFLYEFGLSGFIFSLSIELSKRFLLGDLFLAESLVIFPLAFVIGYLWKLSLGESVSYVLKRYLFLFSLVLIPFQLFTLIPLTTIIIFYLLLKEKFKKRIVLPLVLILAALVLAFLPFVSYVDYFTNTKYAIATHYLEDAVSQGFSQLFYFSFLKPVAALVSPIKGEFGSFIRVLSGIYLLSFIYLLFKEKGKRAFLLFSFFLLGTTGLRLTFPQAALYEGFHGFPWFSAIIFLIIIQLKQVILLNWRPPKRRIIMTIGIALIILLIFSSGQFLLRDYFRPVNQQRDFLVNFSRFVGTGMVIKTLSASGDKLMVIPVEQLLYFESSLFPQNRFLYTYEWIFRNEKLKNELKKNLEENPPTFVYYDYSSVGDDAKALLDPIFVDYIQLRQGDSPSLLLIRRNKLDSLQPEQIEGIKELGFSLPEAAGLE